MAHPPFQRAVQCPHPHCDEWAFLATLEDVVVREAPIWRCAKGHQGPRVIGAEAGPARSARSE